jgi:hypothetical protein
VIHRTLIQGGLWRETKLSVFFLEEPAVTDDTFLPLKGDTALRHFPVGTVLQYSLLLSCSFLSGLGVSCSLDRKKGNRSLPPPPPPFSKFDSSGLFRLGFVKDIVHSEKALNVNESREGIVKR